MHEEVFEKLVATSSTTNSKEELEMAKVVYDVISKERYFSEHPELVALEEISTDALKRTIPWALYLSPDKTDATIILTGHIDTVSIDNFGDLKDYARAPGRLAVEMRKKKMNSSVEEDLNCGEWIFGRGTADMKGGLSCLVNVFCEKVEQGYRKTNILFIAPGDEETYSVGMRNATNIIHRLKMEYGLDYKLLLTAESHLRNSGEALYFDGTIGKIQLSVVVKGVPSHARYYFTGINAARVAADIVSKIDGNGNLSESYMGEKTPPPACMYLRDGKEKYDVTLPEYADIAFSYLMFKKSPSEILLEIKELIVESVKRYETNIEKSYLNWIDGVNTIPQKYSGHVQVLLFDELIGLCKEKDESEFKGLYADIKSEISKKIGAGTLNFNKGTMELIHRLIDFAEINNPVVVLGITPPFYPGFTNADIARDSNAFEMTQKLCDFNLREFGFNSKFEHYFAGISDMSYAATTYSESDAESLAKNMPLWGPDYSIDFDKIRDISMPVMNVGPWGKDIHTGTERVNRRSLFEECSKQIAFIVDELGGKYEKR